MPATRDPSANIRELSKAHPDWPQNRRVAAGLNMARQMGAAIPPYKDTRKKKPPRKPFAKDSEKGDTKRHEKTESKGEKKAEKDWPFNKGR